MNVFSKALLVITLAGPFVLLGSIATLGVGLSIQEENTLNPAGEVKTLAGDLKADCGNPAVSQWATFINDAAVQFNVPAPMIAGVMEQESHGDPKATSRDEHGNPIAYGLMQLIPDTWNGVRAPGSTVVPNRKNPKATVTATKNRSGKDLPNDWYDPEANIYAGSFYLAKLLVQFDENPLKVIAAYNAGPGNVERYSGVPPFKETREYVDYILGTAQKIGYIAKYVDCLQKQAAGGPIPTNNKEARQAVIAAARAAEGTFPAGKGQYCGLQAMAVYRKAGVKDASYDDSSNQLKNPTAADLQPGDMVRISAQNGTVNNDHMIILDSPMQTTYLGKTVIVWSFWGADASRAWAHTRDSGWSWPAKSAVIPYNPASGADGPPLQVWTPQPRK